jgi:putative transposase
VDAASRTGIARCEHGSLGPGVPDPPPTYRDHRHLYSRHRRGESYADRAHPILRVLHHTWGEERIANELLLKLEIHVSPRTVRKYLPACPPDRPRRNLRWSTFLRLHAHGIIACDFLVVVTATFRLLYVFVVIEHRSRRLVHCNVTAHPTAAWTLQQLREAVGFEERHRYLLHDRDSIFAKHLDISVTKLGIRVLKSPPRSPKANAICERVIGTVRRECLDWLTPFSESHLRSILRVWVPHYNVVRPHMALGPDVPDPPPAYHGY